MRRGHSPDLVSVSQSEQREVQSSSCPRLNTAAHTCHAAVAVLRRVSRLLDWDRRAHLLPVGGMLF